MIIGCKNWNEPSGYFRQDNGELENFLRAYGVKNHQAICFPASVCRSITAVGRGEKLWIKSSAGEDMSPEDGLTMYMNHPRYRPALDLIRNDADAVVLPENQIPQYFPYMMGKVFNEKVYFNWIKPETIISMISSKKHAIVVLRNPGHAVCVVAEDTETAEIIYDDPLYGFNLRKKISELPGWLMMWNGVIPIVYSMEE
jgi:hypothetical protein